MKKIFLIAMALMMVAGMAYAEDRLSLNGSFRVWGWSTEGSDWNSDTTQDWIGQRLRVGGKIAVADDVSVNFRMDFGESNWGDQYGPGGGYVVRPRGNNGTTNSSQLDIDRAFVQIDKEFWGLTAGQQYLGLGVAEVLDANVPALNLQIKPMEQLKISLIYAKISENGSYADDTYTQNVYDINDVEIDPDTGEVTLEPRYAIGDSCEDVDFYAFNVSYDADNFSLKAYYGMQDDQTPAEVNPSGGGIYGSMALGMLNLQAELDMFGGDAADGTDFTGTQFYLAADAGLTEMIKLGAEFFYAAGDDTDVQITGWSDWFTFTPMSMNTPMSGEFSAFEPNGTTSPFDPSGAGAGSMGGTLWADFNIMEGLKAGAKIGYWEVDEDQNTFIDSIFAYNAYVSYMIASNTTLALTYMDSSPDLDGTEPAGTTDDSYKVGLLSMVVNF
jgi:hypothetical protein